MGVTTLEGLVRKAAHNLELLQEERLLVGDLDNFYRCRGVITKLRRGMVIGGDNHDDDDDDDSSIDDGGNHHDEERTNKDYELTTTTPFTIILDDPAGNSFIENPHAPHPDPNMTCRYYDRTPTQDMSLGFQPSKEARHAGIIDDSVPSHKNIANGSLSPQHHSIEIEEERLQLFSHDTSNETRTKIMAQSLREEAIKFPTTCPHCRASTETNMCVTNIPHFKEVIIMCLVCDQCGYKSNEIKGGGAIPPLGTKITLHVTGLRDLTREVLKSDTAGISVPELDLELEEGGLDGVYTTVEGLLMKMYGRLRDVNPFGIGDSSVKQHADNDGERYSSPRPQHIRYKEFLARLKGMAEGQRFPFTLILTDPLSNSFVGPLLNAGDALSLQAEEGSIRGCETSDDEGLKVEEFQRTEDQNDNLGLNDIKTHNY